jgi:surface polysaccharide O-acyltransferase-like enzyme
MEEKKHQYLFSADLIRALAIIAVVVIHIFTEYVNNPHIFLAPKWWMINLVDSAARVAVPLFVMLSGYLILNNEKSYTLRQFMQKRVAKIGIPLFAWPLLYYLWILCTHHGTFSLSSLFSDFISLNIYYHLYYLYLIAGLYLITPLLKPFLRSASLAQKRYLIILTFAFSLIVTLLKYFTHIGPHLATVFTVFLPYVCYYLAGDYLREVQLSKKQFARLFLLFIVLCIITAIGTMWHMQFVHWGKDIDVHGASYARYFYDYLSITVVAQSLIAFVLLLNAPTITSVFQGKKSQTTIKLLAVTSFGVYLIHPLIFDITNRYLLRTVDFSSLPTLLFLTGKTAFIFLISFILTLGIRRIPYVKTLVS